VLEHGIDTPTLRFCLRIVSGMLVHISPPSTKTYLMRPHIHVVTLSACVALLTPMMSEAQMSANDAFNLGNAFGTARNAEVREGVKEEGLSSAVPNYTGTSERSSLYSGMRALGPDGFTEKDRCATTGLSASDPREVEACQAVNVLAGIRASGRLISLDKNADPLMIKKREVLADPVSATGMPFLTSLSECSSSTVTTADVTREDTCTDVIPFPKSSSCQMPWEVEVLQHNRYECSKVKEPIVRRCDEILTVQCNTNAVPQITINREWWWCDTCSAKASDMRNLQDAFRAVAQASGATVTFTRGTYGSACFEMQATGGADVMGYYNGVYFGKGTTLRYNMADGCSLRPYGLTLGGFNKTKGGKPMIRFSGNSECPTKVWRNGTKDHPGYWTCLGYTTMCPDGSPPLTINGEPACIGSVTCTSSWDRSACAPYGG